jgi:hypothetical protein
MGCFGTTVNNPSPSLKQRQLENAVLAAETTFHSMLDAGYQQWTPTEAANELVVMLNSAQLLTPEEQAEYEQSGVRLKPVVSYEINRPSDEWQVVLIPDEEAQTIQIVGYGQDLETPLIQEDIPCCY